MKTKYELSEGFWFKEQLIKELNNIANELGRLNDNFEAKNEKR